MEGWVLRAQIPNEKWERIRPHRTNCLLSSGIICGACAVVEFLQPAPQRYPPVDWFRRTQPEPGDTPQQRQRDEHPYSQLKLSMFHAAQWEWWTRTAPLTSARVACATGSGSLFSVEPPARRRLMGLQPDFTHLILPGEVFSVGYLVVRNSQQPATR